MKRKFKLGLTLMVISLALVGTTACGAFGGGDDGVGQQLVKVERGDLTMSVSGSGKIETSHEARLTFGSAGKVEKIYVEEGDKVTTGQVLAELDTSALELSLTQAQVSLTQAELALTQAQLAVNTAEYNLKNTGEQVDALKLALINAQIGVETAEQNLSDTITTYGWDDFKTLESDLNLAKAWYKYVTEDLLQDPSANYDADSWHLALKRAKERLDTAQANYDNFVAGHGNAKITLKKRQVEAAKLSLVQAQKNLDDLAEDITMQ